MGSVLIGMNCFRLADPRYVLTDTCSLLPIFAIHSDNQFITEPTIHLL